MILDEVCKYVRNACEKLGLQPVFLDAGVGIKYTYVVMSSGHSSKKVGLSYTPSEDISHMPSEVGGIQDLNKYDLCRLVTSLNFVSRALAMAALNAISSLMLEGRVDVGVDVLDVMSIGSNDVVCVIGYITPLLKVLRRKAKKVYVLERNPLRRREALPDTAAPRVLSEATKVIISGAAVLNDSLDYLTTLLRRDAEVAVVGATASFLPEPLFKLGIHHVCGFRVIDNSVDRVVELVKLGAGTKEIYRHGYKYCISAEGSA